MLIGRLRDTSHSDFLALVTVPTVVVVPIESIRISPVFIGPISLCSEVLLYALRVLHP